MFEFTLNATAVLLDNLYLICSNNLYFQAEAKGDDSNQSSARIRESVLHGEVLTKYMNSQDINLMWRGKCI